MLRFALQRSGANWLLHTRYMIWYELIINFHITVLSEFAGPSSEHESLLSWFRKMKKKKNKTKSIRRKKHIQWDNSVLLVGTSTHCCRSIGYFVFWPYSVTSFSNSCNDVSSASHIFSRDNVLHLVRTESYEKSQFSWPGAITKEEIPSFSARCGHRGKSLFHVYLYRWVIDRLWTMYLVFVCVLFRRQRCHLRRRWCRGRRPA